MPNRNANAQRNAVGRDSVPGGLGGIRAMAVATAVAETTWKRTFKPSQRNVGREAVRSTLAAEAAFFVSAER